MGDAGRQLWRSLRRLTRSPLYALTTIVILALGIGGATAVFVLVDSVLVRPLPYADPDRLVQIRTRVGDQRWRFSAADYLALEEQQSSFSQVAVVRGWGTALSTPDGARRIRGRRVTWTYFPLLGIQPALGRNFTPDEDRPGAPNVVLASHGFWQRHLGGVPDAVGTRLTLDGESYELIGVLPRATGPLEEGRELFRALRLEPPRRKGPFYLTALGRLGPGVGRAGATRELQAICERLFPVWQDSWPRKDATWVLEDLKTSIVGEVDTVLLPLMGGVGLLYLIACTNAAGLAVARVSHRRRELSVRAALGASRKRLLGHQLSEALLLVAAGSIAGLGIAGVAVRATTRVAADFVPRAVESGFSTNAGLFFAVVGLLSLLFCGLLPALQAAAGDLSAGLRAGSRAETGSPGSRRVRYGLVSVQFAIATPLLIGATLLSLSLLKLNRVDPGFDADRILTAGVSLPTNVYDSATKTAAAWQQLSDRLEALPGVVAVGLANGRPPAEYEFGNNFVLEDRPMAPGEAQSTVPWLVVTPQYFSALGAPLLEGRLFQAPDAELRTVLVDQTWARRFFPGESAIGRRFRHGACTIEGCPWWTVIGVVADIRYTGLDDPGQGTMYLDHRVSMSTNRWVLIRTDKEPATLTATLRKTVHEFEPSATIIDVATGRELIEQSLVAQNSLALLATLFAGIALALSLVGIYGLMAYFVHHHKRDIGIRMALGGSPRLVAGQVLRGGMILAGVGIATGLVLSYGMGGRVQSLLYGVAAVDPAIFVGVAGALLGLALLACFVPSRSAARTDPAVVLRLE